MRYLFRSLLAFTFVAFAQASAWATCERVVQNGTVINGAPVVFIAECLISRAAGSAGSTIVNGLPMITDLGILGPFGILDAPITGAYHQGLFSWVGNNLVVNLRSRGGAGVPSLCLSINDGPLTGIGGTSCGSGVSSALLVDVGNKFLISPGNVLLIQ